MGAKISVYGIWIDQNIDNKENKNYKTKFSTIIGLKVFGFKDVSNALNFLKSLEFQPVLIICSGRLYPEFIINFKNNINIFRICPKIIIFTSNKNKFFEINKDNESLLISHPFFNSGGIVDSYQDIKNFILSNNNKLYQIQDIFPLLYKKIEKVLTQKEEKIKIINNPKIANNNPVQLNFEYVPDRNHLILPIFLSNITKEPSEDEIKDFNKFLIEQYTEKEIVKLIGQLLNIEKVPKEIISKFWVRAYTIECNFYKDMNKELRENKMNKYLPFIQMMYNGVKVKSFYFNPSNSGQLYRGTFFSEEELEKLKYYIKNKMEGLPAAIIYSRSFFSFTLNRSIALQFEKNVTLIINNFQSNAKGCAAISQFSVFKEEEEILIFPLSCFEIKNIIDRGGNKYFINLDYLGQYEQLFEGENLNNLIKLIPKDSSLTNQVLTSNILEEKYRMEITNDYIDLKYKILSNQNKIRIFGANFVKNNRKLIYVYKRKSYNITEYFNIKDLKLNINDEFEIRLINISNINNISYIFNDCISLIYINDIILPNNNLKDMSNMFNNCSALINIGSLNLNTSNVRIMKDLFQGCSSLKNLPDISKWDTSNVKNMENLFNGCSSLKNLPDISLWNTHNVEIIQNLFKDCSSLDSLPDISKWDISHVKNMENLFNGCSSLKSLPNISLWNTNLVYNMENMFKDCSSLASLPDISKWDTSNVNKMRNLFNGCSSLSSLPDISLWNLGNTTDVSQMFFKCESLTSLPDISKWNTKKINHKTKMFFGCKQSLNIPNKFK